MNCSVLLPESILDEFQVDHLMAMSSSKNKLILFLHDAFPVTHPNLVNPKNKIKSSLVMSLLRVSDLISCQTEAVARVAHNLLDATLALEAEENLPLVCVHRRPVLYSKSENLTYSEEAPLSIPLVLALGTIEPRKNYPLLLMACEILWEKGLIFSLKIVGGWGWKTSEVSFFVNKLIEKGRPLLVLSNVSDGEVAGLLSVSSVFVYPSMAEGLGLPPGEALQFGLKPICRYLPSLVETFGKNEITFFDGSPMDLAKKIEIELVSKSLVSSSIVAKQNTWQETASLIMSDINRISK
jgi:glycosyltransferase involved in cell wall biosynthesis